MPEIIIAGTPISFPNSAASPDWAPAVDQFALAVEAALAGLVGSFDVAPQKMILNTVPDAVDTNITNLAFSNTAVRSAIITYAIYRQTDTPLIVTETGTLDIVYNESGGVGNKWSITRETTSDASVNFIVLDSGQIQINTTALGGTPVSSFISYYGKALQNTY
jgi:hypothetical protein